MQPVQPGDPQRRRYTPPPDAPVVNPGDVICASCGTPNEPQRRFCAMCGTPMVASLRMSPGGIALAENAGWWERFLRRRTPSNAVYQVGDRPEVARTRRWPAWVAALVALLAVGGVSVTAVKQGWITSAKSKITDRVSKPAPFVPDGISASSQLSGHPAALAIDGVTNKYWAPSGGRTNGQWLEAHFAQPFRLLDLDVTGGIDTDQAKFLTQERPDAIVITVTDAAGHETTFPFTLADKAGAQQVKVTGANVVRVRVTIQSVYGSAPGRRVGVAEVEFFGRS